jgi:hypothetical protein
LAIADSGTDIHVTNPATAQRLNLSLHKYSRPVTIMFGDSSIITATHFVMMGDIIGEVAIVDSAPATLISIYNIAKKGLVVTFSCRKIVIEDEVTGRKLYQNRVSTPGHYMIDIERFMQIKAPADFESYAASAKKAAETYNPIFEEYVCHTSDTGASDTDASTDFDTSHQPHVHTCSDNNHHQTYNAKSSQLLQSPTLADITPQPSKKRQKRLTIAQTKKILWLHKCMGHPGRDALASFIDAAIGIDEDITPAAVTTVFNHLLCTACALAKRNKSDKMHGSGVYNPTVGDTITVDYQGLITPPSARGNTDVPHPHTYTHLPQRAKTPLPTSTSLKKP